MTSFNIHMIYTIRLRHSIYLPMIYIYLMTQHSIYLWFAFYGDQMTSFNTHGLFNSLHRLTTKKRSSFLREAFPCHDVIMTKPWASYKIRKIGVAHAPGMPGTFFPTRLNISVEFLDAHKQGDTTRPRAETFLRMLIAKSVTAISV